MEPDVYTMAFVCVDPFMVYAGGGFKYKFLGRVSIVFY